MTKATETIALPAEGFALLIRAAAQAIIEQIDGPASQVDTAFLSRQVGLIGELISKFTSLHQKENMDRHTAMLAPHIKKKPHNLDEEVPF